MNTPAAVDWSPALTVLAVGLVFGAVLIWRLLATSRAAGRASKALSLAARDLAGKRDALLRQLRELEDTASKRTPEQLAHERYALELDAAQVLLALEEHGIRPEPKAGRRGAEKRAAEKRAVEERTPEEREAVSPDRAALRGFLWGTATVGAIALLVFFVYQSAKPREAGGSLTGEPGMASGGATGSPADAEEAQIQAALASNPEDAEARLALVQLYAARQNWMGVWTETAKVLERSPGNPRALAYQALVRLAMGQSDVAVGLLRKALSADPRLADAYLYLALGYVQMGRMRDAEATIAQASKRFPDRAADFRRAFAEMRTREQPVAGAGVAGAPDPHAGLKTPGEGAMGARTANAAPGRRVSGTVDLDPSLRSSVNPGGILFVYVRNAGASGGPPVAVKRLPAVFPAAFELSEADSMMGQPFPDPLLIEARLDSDGDPTTRSPTDPKARLDRVKAGRSDVRLVLKRP